MISYIYFILSVSEDDLIGNHISYTVNNTMNKKGTLPYRTQ